MGYEQTTIPDFWRPIFNDNGNELLEIRNNITQLFFQENTDEIVKGQNGYIWRSCAIVERMFPKYFVKQAKPFDLTDADFININNLLCTILLLLGIISFKMKGQDYNFIFKGGKSVQFVLSEILGSSKYISDDIDILITSNTQDVYNEEIMKNLSEHISFLIKWFIPPNIKLSLELPESKVSTMGKKIVKIAYLNDNKKPKPFPLVDVGFNKINENVARFFNNPKNFQFSVPELNTNLLFRCPEIQSILEEKLHYYLKYVKLRDILKNGGIINEKGYENLTIDNINYFTQKFKRSIMSIIDGLIIRDHGNITQDEMTEMEVITLRLELGKVDNDDLFDKELLKNAITDLINKNPYIYLKL